MSQTRGGMSNLRTRKLGRQGLEVSEIGLGCMGMSELLRSSGRARLRPISDNPSRGLDLGITLLDTADIYGPFTNEKLVGRAIAGRRDQVVLATKFGIVAARGWRPQRPTVGRSTSAAACEASLKRLGVGLHRPVLPASCRPGDSDRGDCRCHGRTGRRRKGPVHRPLGSGAGDDPPRARRAP